MSAPFADHPCGAHMRAIHRISAALFAKTDMDQVLRETLDASLQITNADAGSILLYDPEARQLVFRYAVGPVAHKLIGQPLPLTSTGKCATVFKTGQSDISVGGFDHSIDIITEYSTKSTLTTPIRNFSNEPIGVIQVLNKIDPPNVFNAHDQELLEVVSALAATVIENARRAELEKQTALARAEAEKQAALARVLGFIGHQLKNQAFIIEQARQTFGAPIAETIEQFQEEQIPGAGQLAEDYAELQTMLQSAAAKIIAQARIINEYGQRQDLFQFKPNDLQAVLMGELEQLAELAEKYGYRVDLSRMTAVPIFPCEAFFVSQAVFNLVHNAFQAMREQGKGDTVCVRLEAQETGSFPDGNYVEILVEDNGPGMPAEALADVLRGQAKSDKPGGSGVGTRLVRDVALTHGGLFLGESRPGAGTTFRLRLPLRRERPAANA